MKVKAIAITTPLIENENCVQMSPDEFIAYCARVSNPDNQMNSLTAPKLLKYCAKNNHWSVFEAANINMSVETTRDIARQILRHRSFSFQEFSQRYADPTASLGFETREARMQDTKNRQNSIEILHEDGDRAANLIDEWNDRQQNLIQQAMDDYRWALDKGIAKEQARAVLPEGMTVSRLYMNGTVRSWIHYCQLRMNNGTQKEHREIATACWAEVIKYFPSLSETIVIGE